MQLISLLIARISYPPRDGQGPGAATGRAIAARHHRLLRIMTTIRDDNSPAARATLASATASLDRLQHEVAALRQAFVAMSAPPADAARAADAGSPGHDDGEDAIDIAIAAPAAPDRQGRAATRPAATGGAALRGAGDAAILARLEALIAYRADMEEQLHAASEIMRRHDVPEALSDCELRYEVRPREIIGGDFVVGERNGDGTLYVLHGDFCGHRLLSAMGVLAARDMFTSVAARAASLEEVALGLNQRLRRLLPQEMFLAANLFEIVPARGALRVWNAGMPEVLVRADEGGSMQSFASMACPLGVLGGDAFRVAPQACAFDERATLLSLSDGVTEAPDAAQRPLGSARVAEIVAAACGEPYDAVLAGVAGHLAGGDLRDDLSIVQLRLRPRGAVG